MKHKNVHKAILNMKQYTKQLKQNVSTTQQISQTPQSNHQYQKQERNILSYSANQFYTNHYLNHKFNKKNSNHIINCFDEKSSPRRESNNRKQGLSRTSKGQKNFKQNSKTNMTIDITESLKKAISPKIDEQFKKSHTTNFKKIKSNYKSELNKHQMQQIESQNKYESIISQLVTKVTNLSNLLAQYKQVMLEMRSKFLSMQIQLKQKINLQHMLDLTQQQLKNQQQRNLQLVTTFAQYQEKQNERSRKLNKATNNLSQNYISYLTKVTSLEKQNAVLREILRISSICYPKGNGSQDKQEVGFQPKIQLMLTKEQFQKKKKQVQDTEECIRNSYFLKKISEKSVVKNKQQTTEQQISLK